MSIKENFSLCPKKENAREQLAPLFRYFANQYAAQITERSAEAENELSRIDKGKDIIASSGGTIILITIEKADRFRVTVTNLGLQNKVAMTVRYFGSNEKDYSITDLFKRIEQLWTIQAVTDGVKDDPPCSAAS